MSLVVAIKDGDRFVLGSDKQASTNLNKEHSATKIWECKDFSKALVAGVGSCRASQIIQHNSLIDWNTLMAVEHIDTDFIVNNIVPAIVAQLRANGIACGATGDTGKELFDISIPNIFIFAIEDRAWMIYNDLSVTEIDDYIAIGSGADCATGVLFATKEKNPFERIVTCIEAAAESTLFVDNRIDFLATLSHDTDKDQINKAFGLTAAEEANDNSKDENINLNADKKKTSSKDKKSKPKNKK